MRQLQIEQKTNKNTVSHLGKRSLFISLMYSIKSFKVQPNRFPIIFYFLIGKKSPKKKFLSLYIACADYHSLTALGFCCF